MARDEVNKLTQSSNKRLDWVWTNTVTYSKAFGKNNLTALLGTEAKKNHSESMFGYGTGLAVEDEDYIYLDGVTAGKNVGAGASNYGMVSYFGKVNYDYEGRYLLLLQYAVMLLPAWQRVITLITSLQCRQAGAFQVRSLWSDQELVGRFETTCFMGYQW